MSHWNEEYGCLTILFFPVVYPFLIIRNAIRSIRDRRSKPKRAKNVRCERVGLLGHLAYDVGFSAADGYEYERYVACWLERKGYRDVGITPKSGDYGADIICYDRKKKKWAVQCKYYSKPVGYKAIEEVLGAAHYYGCGGAMVVTNSTFTRQAVEAANRTCVKLVDRVR